MLNRGLKRQLRDRFPTALRVAAAALAFFALYAVRGTSPVPGGNRPAPATFSPREPSATTEPRQVSEQIVAQIRCGARSSADGAGQAAPLAISVFPALPAGLKTQSDSPSVPVASVIDALYQRPPPARV